jgi:hypothetical protein
MLTCRLPGGLDHCEPKALAGTCLVALPVMAVAFRDSPETTISSVVIVRELSHNRRYTRPRGDLGKPVHTTRQVGRNPAKSIGKILKISFDRYAHSYQGLIPVRKL